MKERTAELTQKWKKRYQISDIMMTRLAADAPQRGLALSNKSGVMQLYAWNVVSGEMQQRTNFPTGKMFGFLSPDGEYIYYLKDEGSNEIGHYVRVPFEGGQEEDITPDLPLYASFSMTMGRKNGRLVLMAANQEGFQLFALDQESTQSFKKPRLIYKSPLLLQNLCMDYEGLLTACDSIELSRELQTNLLVIDAESGQKVAELWDGKGSSLSAVSFSPLKGDKRLLASSNASGYARPLIWNPLSGERQDIPLPELQGDVKPIAWAPDAAKILLSHFSQAVQQLYVYDLKKGKLVKLNHPEGSFSAHMGAGTYYTPQGDIYTHWQDSTHPSQLIALDGESGEQKAVILPAETVPAGRPLRSVVFPSSDGQEIQAWVGVPEGEGPFPTIFFTHGGPTSVAKDAFDAGAQAWLDHGFAFISLNYRGSTTFGKDYQDKILGNLGHWEIEDIRAAWNWLVNYGITDPKRVFKTGWSYGGFLTLMSMGRLPELFAGGMAGIAIADWNLMYEDQAETLRGYQVALFGGAPDTRAEQYRVSSPITYAENIDAPVLIIQGSNDSRCPVRQMQAYLDKTAKLGKQVSIEWFDAGHGSLKIEEEIKHTEMMLDFVYNILK